MTTLNRRIRRKGYLALIGLPDLFPNWGKPRMVDMVKRRYAWGVKHYGEVIHDTQCRRIRQIRERLTTQDYRCRLPDAKHPVIKVKMGRLDLRDKRRRIWFYA